MVTNDPEALLGRLLVEPGENDWLEFKHNNSSHEMIGKWVSACANAAILAARERAYLVWGIEDGTRKKVGTSVRLRELKISGGELFTNWISRTISPSLMMEFLDFAHDGKTFSILVIEPTYDRPVAFKDKRYLRIGESVRELSDHPEHEKSLWLATSKHRFEGAIALPHQSEDDILTKLDVAAYYKLAREELPKNPKEIIRRFMLRGFIREDMEGHYDITNLGAILFASDIGTFPSIATKSVRFIRYVGRDKRTAAGEIEGRKGYAAGFSGLMGYIMKAVPTQELYRNGVRSVEPIYPDTAVRELIANALIHQDFTISGVGPVIDMYSDRMEVTNPGHSLIEVDRIVDERRSRNEKLAAEMRSLGLCEERGGGIDKALLEIERRCAPPPDFISSKDSMRVVVFPPRPFDGLTKSEKQRACFFHCILCWIKSDYMTNTSLRERFMLQPTDYQLVSAIISEAVKKGRIAAADPAQGRKHAKYVPYWIK